MFGRQDKLLRRMLLRRPAPHDSSDIPPDASRRVGASAETFTPLRPVGAIRMADGRCYPARTPDNAWLPANLPVRIVQVAPDATFLVAPDTRKETP